MKKAKRALLGLAVLVSLAGCASAPQRQVGATMLLAEADGIKLDVVKHYEFGDSWYQSAHKGDTFTTGFSIRIENLTDSAVKIIWNNSSITDDVGTHRFFMDGMRYIDANKDIPPTVMPPRGSISRAIYSADSVKYGSGLSNIWIIHAMKGTDFTITVCVEIQGQEYYFTIQVTVSELPS